MKYTKEQLALWANGDLVIPGGNYERYEQAKFATLEAIVPTLDHVGDEDLIADLVPFSLYSDLSAIISDLAELLLEEREERNNVLKEAKRDLQDSIRTLDELIGNAVGS